MSGGVGEEMGGNGIQEGHRMGFRRGT